MFVSFEDNALQVDRSDLLAILELRFGQVPSDVASVISRETKREILERLILVAANVPDWQTMLSELSNSDGAFRIVGEDFNPVVRNLNVQGKDEG